MSYFGYLDDVFEEEERCLPHSNQPGIDRSGRYYNTTDQRATEKTHER